MKAIELQVDGEPMRQFQIPESVCFLVVPKHPIVRGTDILVPIGERRFTFSGRHTAAGLEIWVPVPGSTH